MTAQAGSQIVVSFEDDSSSPVHRVVAGLRTRSMAFNHESVDVTNANSTGLWRELLSSGGVRSASVSGSGVFKDDSGVEAVRDAFFEGEQRNVTFFVPAFGTFRGLFQVTQFTVEGEFNGEVTYSLSFESAGAITFVAA